MLNLDKAHIFAHIFEQHVNDAAFLWLMRSQAMNQPHQDIMAISKLENRINNHLKGLQAAPDAAWEYALQAAGFAESGEIFILAMLALTSGNREKIHVAVELASAQEETLKALVSAVAWLPGDRFNLQIKLWMQSANPIHRYIAVAACSLKRLDPKNHLKDLFNDPHNSENTLLFSRMLRLVGELKRHDLAPALAKAQQHSNAEIVFWANWSALLLGNSNGVKAIEPFVLQTGPHQTRAINLAFRCQQPSQAWAWINKLINSPDQTLQAIIAMASLGDSQGINWLLARMEEPAYAKAAGEAFSLITGVDVSQQALKQAAPANNHEDDDEMPLFDGYENLPLPDAEKLGQHWRKIRQDFTPGRRYFLGKAIEPTHLEQVFLNGRQTQRLASAMEFALLNPVNVYANAKCRIDHWRKI